MTEVSKEAVEAFEKAMNLAFEYHYDPPYNAPISECVKVAIEMLGDSGFTIAPIFPEDTTSTVGTDNAPADVVIAGIIECASAWDPNVRLIGNVRAGDIKRALLEKAPIAPVTDEKLRELSVLAHDILDGEGYDEAALEVKAALSELAQLRADDGDKRMLFAKAIDYGQADAVVFVPHNGDVVMLEVTAKLPTPPKED